VFCRGRNWLSFFVSNTASLMSFIKNAAVRASEKEVSSLWLAC
jgi:hypothetical protein